MTNQNQNYLAYSNKVFSSEDLLSDWIVVSGVVIRDIVEDYMNRGLWDSLHILNVKLH